MEKGNFNRLLSIDLTRRSVEVVRPNAFHHRGLGGKELGVKILLAKNPKGIDPFDPQNLILFLGGPATGTPVWGSCRYGVYSKSPLTGLFGEAYSGGSLATCMAKAGIDGLIIHGASDTPIWLEINPGAVEFHDASGLWGKGTYEAEMAILAWLKEKRAKLKFPAVATIGPAGENLVRFALIENDLWRSAGRTGLGAVMGSKRLKAIAFWGDAPKEVYDPKGLSHFVKEIYTTFKETKTVQTYKTLGTPSMLDTMDALSAFPAFYWSQGKVSFKAAIDAEALHKRMDVKPHACLNCFLSCGRLGRIKEGSYKGLKIEGPEYETIYAFGGLCGIKTIEEIAYLNDLCDRLGIDTITCGNLASFAIEANKRKGLHLDLDYGDTKGIGRFIEEMVFRKGTPGLFSDGIREAAARLELEDLAVHVKGMEPAGYDPRVLKGMALAYATSPRGACHLRSTFYKAELLGLFDPEDPEAMARVFVDWEDRLIIMDSLILCRFYRDLYDWDNLGRIFGYLTGPTPTELKAVAKEVADEVRWFNLREGMNPKEDTLPKRFFEEPLPETGALLKEEELRNLILCYYRLRGWTQEGYLGHSQERGIG